MKTYLDSTMLRISWVEWITNNEVYKKKEFLPMIEERKIYDVLRLIIKVKFEKEISEESTKFLT